MGKKLSRRVFLESAVATPIGIRGLMPAQNAGKSEPAKPRQEEGALGIADLEELTDRDGSYADYPVLSADHRGGAWIAWLSRLQGDKEVILARQYRGKWLPASAVTAVAGQFEAPRIACGPGGRTLILWIAIDGDRWLLQSSLHDGSKFSAPVSLDAGPGKVANPCLIAGKDNAFWAAWERYHQDKFTIALKQFAAGHWRETIEITDGKRNAYDPAIALDRQSGKVWITFSGVTDKLERAIYLTSYDAATQGQGSLIEVARGGYMKMRPNMNTHPDVSCDDEGRVWVAYEHDSNRSLRAETPRPLGGASGNYWGRRECSVLCYDHGKLLQVKPQSADHSGRVAMMDKNDHFPTLTFDGRGRLWLFSRDSTPFRRAWTIRASCLEGKHGWTKPVEVLTKERKGRLSRPAVAVADKDSFWLAWQADNVLGKLLGGPDAQGRRPLSWGKNEDVMCQDLGFGGGIGYDSVELISGIFIAKVQLPAAKPQAEGAVLEKASSPSAGSMYPDTPRVQPRPWIPRRKVIAGGQHYTLLYGNLHEHTLISRCWDDGSDGIPDDEYRYGRDIEGYDFAALTDHGYDLSEAKWREIRRASKFYLDAPHFIALPAYEWTRSRGPDGVFPSNGHRNIIFVRDADAAKFVSSTGAVHMAYSPASNHITKIWQLLRSKGISEVVTIPHHSMDSDNAVNWDSRDLEFQTAVEIYQCRWSQEYVGCPHQAPYATRYGGASVQDALARGFRLGFIASGDHNNVGAGVAALLVKEVSRSGIIEALRARRCYGTTGDKIFLDFRINGHLMGEEFTAAAKPQITASIEGTDQLASVVIFKNNKVVYEKKADDLGRRKSSTFDFVDENFGESAYYYLRVIQANNEMGWASPVWVNHST